MIHLQTLHFTAWRSYVLEYKINKSCLNSSGCSEKDKQSVLNISALVLR